ncbi:MAG TPA: FN3 domain-containing metallophosphoesterase family protein [Mariniphaga sp.]|nr:FN3 domain-containing metallophosphoesterase family protein [Mariniphaga sp.]
MIIHYRLLISFLLFPLFLISQEIMITHGPYIQAVSENEVTIVWTTDSDGVSWVEIAPEGNNSFYAQEHPKYYETRNGNRVIGKLHKITIPNLEKGTTYRYRAFTEAVLSYEGHRVLFGNIASTNVYRTKPLRFKTLDSDKSSISFLVVNDIHGRNDDLKAFSKQVNFDNTDLVFFNGDMVSSMNSEEQFFEGFMDKAVELFASEVPAFFSRGNHETRGPFSVYFPDYFPTPTGKLYYSFRQGPVHFIVLDCGEDKPDSDIEYSGLAQFDAYRTEQQEWLKKEIEKEEFKSAPYKLVVVHIPPIGSDWHGPNDLRRKILPVLKDQGITAMLCGHTHRYQYVEADGHETDFPILINAHNSAFEVDAKSTAMTIVRKDLQDKELNRFVLKP